MATFWYKLRVDQAWKFKAPFILSAIYLVVFVAQSQLQLVYILLSFCTILGIAGIGYLSNDFGDRASDQKSGKPNFFTNKSGWGTWVFAVFIGLLAFTPWTFFPWDVWSLVLLGGEILAFILYALPPFRLKKNVMLAPLMDALYAHVIPSLLAAHTFLLIAGIDDVQLLILMGIWQLFYGVRAFVNHLFMDRSNDLISYATLATKGNAHDWRAALALLSIVEFSAMLLITWIYLTPWMVVGFLALAAGGAVFAKSVYSFRSNVIDRLYVTAWPVAILILISFRDPEYWWVLGIHVLLFQSHFENQWIDQLIRQIRKWISVLVNNLIYFFRKFILWQSEEKARKQYYPQYVIDRNNRQKMKKTGTITLANLNKDKYSETYIHHYKDQLPTAVDFLHGGYPPMLDEQNEMLGKSDSIERALIQRLKKTRSRLILAHFGPMGVSMMPIAKTTGVPLVVYFHAYDIHHQQQLSVFRDQYLELFRFAHLLLASSQEIADKLIEMGASESKVKYLPAFFPVENFLHLERNPEPLNILAVGRLADTKAPHILLLAFQKVLETIPEAQLTLVGEGELLESSIVLAQALKIDSQVEFAGKQTPEEVLEHLKTAQVFVQHSVTTPLHHDREGTPVAVMEAMAAGLPVISTRHAGIQELIRNGENGCLVNELDIDAMAGEMIRCLNSTELCDRLASNAKASIRSNSLIMDHMKIMTQIIEDYGLRI